MSKPIVAIVGRPNVGKSTLFNALAGERISIVEDTPGVTRDRITADCSWLDRDYLLIDTGGIDPDNEDILFAQMQEQAQIAMDMADVILFLTDVREGLTESDKQVAALLRKSNKPVVLAVNKTDDFDKFLPDVYEFYNLGIGDPFPISAASRLGIGDLLDEVTRHFPLHDPNEEEEDRPKIAIVGKPNVGKSSIVNRLLGENRIIVSDVAGTTRDSIDSLVKYHQREYLLIDTAGIRRKKKVKGPIEHYSVLRAVAAIERADVAVLVIDAAEGVTEQDAKIAGLAHDRGKGMLIAVNKWDLVEKDNQTTREYTQKIRQVLSFMPYAEILFISARTGQRLTKLYDAFDLIIRNQNLRIATGVLNEILSEATALQQPPADRGRRLRIYYATQASVKPPTFVIFVNDKDLMHFSYQRYLENRFRETFGFRGTPLRLIIRERREKE